MSAREIIEKALGRGSASQADEVLVDLAFAGYRILAPGELDKETVERCAAIAEEDVRSPLAKQYDHHPAWYAHALRIGKAIRTLGERP